MYIVIIPYYAVPDYCKMNTQKYWLGLHCCMRRPSTVRASNFTTLYKKVWLDSFSGYLVPEIACMGISAKLFSRNNAILLVSIIS